MQENEFARQNVAPDEGISRSSFSEAINHRGLEQLQYVFENLYKQASAVLPDQRQL
jgi:predicted kinase